MRIGIPVSESQCTKICKAYKRTASTRNRARRVSNVLAHAHAIVHGPPDDFEPRKKLRPPSERFIKDHYEQLSDLAEKGILTVVQRPADYRERRDDGYKEPECIFVVGTAHFSEQSAEDVDRVIEGLLEVKSVLAVRPENVVLEVCRSRTAVIYDQELLAGGPEHAAESNSMSLSGPSFMQALLRSARLGGSSAMLLRAVLSTQAARVSRALAMRSGVEMRAARRAAERIGAQIVLGDRPIEITLQRTWQALTWQQRFKLLGLLLQSGFVDIPQLNAEAVEALKDDDVITSAIAEYSQKVPQMVGPLLHERDLYLAWSLKRSKAVNGTNNVVGVIGKGHVRGVLYNLTNHDSSGLRFRDLVGSQNVKGGSPEQRQKLARRVAFELALAAVAYFAWEAFKTHV